MIIAKSYYKMIITHHIVKTMDIESDLTFIPVCEPLNLLTRKTAIEGCTHYYRLANGFFVGIPVGTALKDLNLLCTYVYNPFIVDSDGYPYDPAPMLYAAWKKMMDVESKW